MPFDMAPQETKIKVGRFQNITDLMLRGCEMSKPIKCAWVIHRPDGVYTCAAGAVVVATGGDGREAFPPNWKEMVEAYHRTYGSSIIGDNDSRGFTREQIAARIAAL